MKLDKTYLLDKAAILATFIKRFRFILVFAAFSMMYAYVLMQVNAINARQPSNVQITEKTTAAPRTKIDPRAAEQITSLQENSVDIKAIFNEARKNPFAE